MKEENIIMSAIADILVKHKEVKNIIDAYVKTDSFKKEINKVCVETIRDMACHVINNNEVQKKIEPLVKRAILDAAGTNKVQKAVVNMLIKAVENANDLEELFDYKTTDLIHKTLAEHFVNDIIKRLGATKKRTTKKK